MSAAPSAMNESAPASIRVDTQPTVVVVPSDEAYLVLRCMPEQRAGGIVWDVVYLAGIDAAELARPDASTRLASSARGLVEAFGRLAEVAQVGHISVTAVFGTPGGRAALHRLWFTRDAAGWHLDGVAGQHAAAQLPPIATEVVRDREEEASARHVAAGFMSDVDRADYDSAWTKTSAVVKAAMSRVDFERHLDALPRAVDKNDEAFYVSFSVPMARFLPGANIVAWVSRASAEGPAIEMLVLRLDDDIQWRVAGVVELTEATAPSAISAAANAAHGR